MTRGNCWDFDCNLNDDLIHVWDVSGSDRDNKYSGYRARSSLLGHISLSSDISDDLG
jgi:hypothetical protein